MEVTGRGQRYVVLDDPLPAGLIALNAPSRPRNRSPKATSPSTTTTSITSLRKSTIRFRPNYFEIRTNRVLAFRGPGFSGSQRFNRRAVCEGKFMVPATRVAAMSPRVSRLLPGNWP